MNAKTLVSKSSLFNGNGNSTPNINNNSIGVVSHGKPNYAPRPPPLQFGGKPNIARHHSMKSPRYFFVCFLYLDYLCLKSKTITLFLLYRTPPIGPQGGSMFATLRQPGNQLIGESKLNRI